MEPYELLEACKKAISEHVEPSLQMDGGRIEVAGLDGKILQVNELLNSQPELINSDPFNQGWLFEVTAPNAAVFENLLSSEAYGEITQH